MKRVKLHTFEECDQPQWIARVENFFEVQNIIQKENCDWFLSARKGMQISSLGFSTRKPKTHLGRISQLLKIEDWRSRVQYCFRKVSSHTPK